MAVIIHKSYRADCQRLCWSDRLRDAKLAGDRLERLLRLSGVFATAVIIWLVTNQNEPILWIVEDETKSGSVSISKDISVSNEPCEEHGFSLWIQWRIKDFAQNIEFVLLRLAV